MAFVSIVVLMCAGGCVGSDPRGPKLRDIADSGARVGAPADTDGDGLCDTSELELGTDPERADTDADALPDAIELANGFDPVGPESPASDQVGFLSAQSGNSVELSVRATVDGNGQGVRGSFEALGSSYGDGLDAASFFEGASVRSADPVENVRGIDGEQTRIGVVLGETRVVFTLRFVYSGAELDDCARVYPFRYALKNDSGETLSRRQYLLVVGPAAQGLNYCTPEPCE